MLIAFGVFIVSVVYSIIQRDISASLLALWAIAAALILPNVWGRIF